MTISSFCNWGECVAVSANRGAVWVWNTRAPGAQVFFTKDEWDAFVAGVKAGEFDHAVLAATEPSRVIAAVLAAAGPTT